MFKTAQKGPFPVLGLESHFQQMLPNWITRNERGKLWEPD